MNKGEVIDIEVIDNGESIFFTETGVKVTVKNEPTYKVSTKLGVVNVVARITKVENETVLN